MKADGAARFGERPLNPLDTPQLPASSTSSSATPQPPALAVTARDAALLLSVSPRHLWSLTNRGEVPHVRAGRKVLYPVAALEAWLAARTKGGPK
jgi:excisionase family DNA binding protein